MCHFLILDRGFMQQKMKPGTLKKEPLNSGACIPMMHREILWRHRKTARIITIPMIQREESLANGRGERRFMKTIMMHAAV